MEMTINVNISAPELCRTLGRLIDALRGTQTEAQTATPAPVPQQPAPGASAPIPVAPPATAPERPVPVAAAVPIQPAAAVPQTAPVPTAPTAVPQTAPAPAMPVAQAPAYTLDQISKAGAALVDAGKMDPLLALLTKYGVQAITQLPPAQYGTFATELRALGAQL